VRRTCGQHVIGATAASRSARGTPQRSAASQLGPIALQFPARLENGRVVWGDIWVGCHLFECDGKTKFTLVADGGVAEKSATEVVWEEKKRERLLHRVGLGTSRIFFEDYWSPQREVALVRMKAEYDETVARFGDQLPEHLVRNARELRDRRAG